MDALHEKTQALNLYEFWSVGKQGEHEAVRDLAKFDHAVPHIWKYSDIRPCLVKAGELIPMEESGAPLAHHVQPGAQGSDRNDHDDVRRLPHQQPGRDRPGASPFAQRDPLRADRPYQLHRGRGRADHVRAGRPGADAA